MKTFKYNCLIISLMIIAVVSVSDVTAQEKFPIPSGNPKQLFYLQRTPNTNTVVYELNMKNGVLDIEEPVHVYWMRYEEKGQKEELNYVQRKFAYGMKAQLVSKDKFELNFVSYKKYPLYLIKGVNNKYNVFGTINQKQAIVSRIFVKINGGSFWSPNVEYIEIKGIDPSTGKEITERRKI